MDKRVKKFCWFSDKGAEWRCEAFCYDSVIAQLFVCFWLVYLLKQRGRRETEWKGTGCSSPLYQLLVLLFFFPLSILLLRRLHPGPSLFLFIATRSWYAALHSLAASLRTNFSDCLAVYGKWIWRSKSRQNGSKKAWKGGGWNYSLYMRWRHVLFGLCRVWGLDACLCIWLYLFVL